MKEYILKIFLFTIFITISFIAIYNLSFIDNAKLKFIKVEEFNYDSILKKLKQKLEKKLNVKQKPLRNQFWEQVNEFAFFKRSSAFYIIEKSLLRIYFASKSNKNFKFHVKIKAYHQNQFVSFVNLKKNGTIKSHVKWADYELSSLNFNFDLLEHLDVDSYDDIVDNNDLVRLHLFIKDSANVKSRTWHPIDIRVKYLRSRENGTKSGSIICSKCYYFEKENYKDLLWWLELNKRFGYKKVVFCNQSIPNTNQFNEIFKHYKDFIELKQMQTFPDFINNQDNLSSTHHNYLTHYLDLKLNGNFYDYYRDIFDVLNENECFLENAGKYEHVSVFDNDETIIPRVNSKIAKSKDNFDYVSSLNPNANDFIKLDSYCDKNNDGRISKYFDSIKKSSNLHFRMSYYIKNPVLKDIFKSIESYFNSKEFNKSSAVHVIKAYDSMPASAQHTPYNFSFLIKNEYELSYAKNLLFIYRNYLEKYLDKLPGKYFDDPDKFNRIFYVAGPITSHYCGKTAYHTNEAFDFTVHYPEDNNMHWVDYDLGQNSHFRRAYLFNLVNMSITELVLDMNYFSCYYKPMLKYLTNLIKSN